MEGWLYLAVSLDLSSHAVVGDGSTAHGSMNAPAVQMTLQRRTPRPGLVHHSDQESQYAAITYSSTGGP